LNPVNKYDLIFLTLKWSLNETVNTLKWSLHETVNTLKWSLHETVNIPYIEMVPE